MSLSSWDSLSNKTFSLFRWRFCCSRRALVCSATFLVSFSNASSSSRVFFWISCSTFKGSSSIAFKSFLFLFKRPSWISAAVLIWSTANSPPWMPLNSFRRLAFSTPFSFSYLLRIFCFRANSFSRFSSSAKRFFVCSSAFLCASRASPCSWILSLSFSRPRRSSSSSNSSNRRIWYSDFLWYSCSSSSFRFSNSFFSLSLKVVFSVSSDFESLTSSWFFLACCWETFLICNCFAFDDL